MYRGLEPQLAFPGVGLFRSASIEWIIGYTYILTYIHTYPVYPTAFCRFGMEWIGNGRLDLGGVC